ncbi:hypothetical protein ACFYO7_32325 [Nocardia salmonicida]|uniref:hypothetical protein n=1 Tax=Nocardia salmonicida TaxID=53431 RepID=UPI0036896557
MASSTSNQSGSHPEPGRLPLRWFVILGAAGTAGTVVGMVSEVALGAGVAIALIGLLDKILDR